MQKHVMLRVWFAPTPLALREQLYDQIETKHEHVPGSICAVYEAGGEGFGD